MVTRDDLAQKVEPAQPVKVAPILRLGIRCDWSSVDERRAGRFVERGRERAIFLAARTGE
jgi:hypothetical protein